MSNSSIQNPSTDTQDEAHVNAKQLKGLLELLVTKVEKLEESIERMEKGCVFHKHQDNNWPIMIKTNSAYDQELHDAVKRMGHNEIHDWVLDTWNKRTYSPLSGSVKQKSLAIAKRYIVEKTSWGLTDQALQTQANKMYLNTRRIAHDFCVRHFPGKKGTQFCFGKQSISQILQYAAMFDYAIWKIHERLSDNDMENAVLPVHMARNSWLSRAILSSVFRDNKKRNKPVSTTTKESNNISEPQSNTVAATVENHASTESQISDDNMPL
ncbi:hypothetical protein EDC96DRAFT_530881, partial [Choanephora cucurbitarum]